MDKYKLLLVFNPDTMDLEINAPEMPSDFAISLLDRAKKMIENQEKLVMAQQIRSMAESDERTNRVLQKVKL